MKFLRGSKALLGMAIISSFMGASIANASAIIRYGDTYLGVNNEGHLNVFPSDVDGISDEFLAEFGGEPVGLWRDGLGDATAPGCLCEGWGVAATTFDNRVSGWASVDNGGIGGITGGTFGSNEFSITSNVDLSDAAISVQHAYGRSLADGVFQASITIENNTGSVLSDVVYRRAMDWDIPPTEFNEFVTHVGVEANSEANGGNVRYASDNGFANVNPLISAGAVDPSTINVDFEDNGPNDHGSVFDFAFGEIEANGTRTFNIFYGSAAGEEAAIEALELLNADVYSLGQQAGSPDEGLPATFLFGFGGVGGTEPGSSEDNPVLPFVPAPGEFVFTSPEPGRWFDPPFAFGFEYELTGGAVFSELITPSAALGFGDIELVVGGTVVEILSPGELFDFSTLGFDVTEFRLVGLDRLLDIEDPGFATAFPLFLDWTGSATELLMTALTVDSLPPTGVDEPQVLVLFLISGLFLIRRMTKKSQHRVM
ncbi:hypothetical protein [Alteromonas gracilis]|uniref:hypothetical protein n=1 Tax=Alteromonas gracilis TaxID=1479524 RepID=UPI003734EE8A